MVELLLLIFPPIFFKFIWGEGGSVVKLSFSQTSVISRMSTMPGRCPHTAVGSIREEVISINTGLMTKCNHALTSLTFLLHSLLHCPSHTGQVLSKAKPPHSVQLTPNLPSYQHCPHLQSIKKNCCT